MKWAIVLMFMPLAACENSAVDELLIRKAQQSAGMPDCPSLRAIDGIQGDIGEGTYRVTADFKATPQCVRDWELRLKAMGWFPDHHGVWTGPEHAVAVVFADHGVGVIWYQDHPEPGIHDRTYESNSVSEGDTI